MQELPQERSAVLLAAGLGRRMGGPTSKMLLPLQGQPLCRHAAQTLAAAGYTQLWAVVPAGRVGDAIQEALSGLPFGYIVHPQPSLGLASSFRLAAQALPDWPSTFALADMPFVTLTTHQALWHLYQEAQVDVMQVRYGKVAAPPTLFGPQLLPALRQLPDADSGPRELLRLAKLGWLERPATELTDVDTPQQWAALAGQNQRPSG